jgi:hypothetical protein
MLPHEKALVERLKDKPFALLGINCGDGKIDEVAPRLVEEGIAWRNAIDDEAEGASLRSLAKTWNVHGFPQLYLVDAKGVIRQKWLGSPGDEVLDKEIDALVAEASSAR